MPEPLIGRRQAAIYAKGVVKRARRFRKPRLGFPYTAPPVPATVDPPPQTDRLGPAYDTRWARRPAARVARGAIVESVLRPSIAAVAKPDRLGLDRLGSLDKEQNALFVANHHSHLDTSLLLTSIPLPWRHRMVVGAAADYFFDTQVKATLSALAIGAFPIDRHSTGRASADQAAELVHGGHSLIIFPEGGRSPDGWGQPFKGGAAYLALRCRVPIVPVFLAGTGRVWRKGQRLPKPARTTVVFGDPIWPTEGDNTRRLNAAIEAAVNALGDELTTDWYSARKRLHADQTPTLVGPRASSWRRAWALGDRAGGPLRRRPPPSWPR